jgi:hypothetical protein
VLFGLLIFLIGSPKGPPGAVASDLHHEFSEANALKDGSACDEAVLRYQELVDQAPPGHELVPPARYNQAVCFEELHLPAAALETHRMVSGDKHAPRSLRADAGFRAGLILVALGEDREARRTLRPLARTLGSPEREVVVVHLAWIDARTGKRRAAARALKQAVPVLESAFEDERPELAPHLAVASLAMGDVVAGEALGVEFRGRADSVRDALNRVGETVEAANSYYLDAIRYGDPTWAAAAALRLGGLFVEFHARFGELRAGIEPRPRPGWSKGEAAAMSVWLSDRLEPLFSRAREAYELCSRLPERTGTDNRFTRECTARLAVPPF